MRWRSVNQDTTTIDISVELSPTAPYTAACTVTYNSTAGSPHSVTATYDGDPAFAASTSGTLSQTVNPDGWTTASLTDSNDNPIMGASVVFRSASGTVADAKTGPDGTTGAALTPGTYSVTMYYATGYQTQKISVTADGPNAVSFSTVAVTAQISDPSSADISAASAAHAGNTGTFGPKIPVDSNGDVTFQVLPGTNYFTAWDANGYQTQTLTVTANSPSNVTFSTVPVTVNVLKNGNPLTTASVAHAGNTGTFAPKIPVDSNGDVTFQVLPGTSYFTAWDGSAYQKVTLTVTAATSISISVA